VSIRTTDPAASANGHATIDARGVTIRFGTLTAVNK